MSMFSSFKEMQLGLWDVEAWMENEEMEAAIKMVKNYIKKLTMRRRNQEQW